MIPDAREVATALEGTAKAPLGWPGARLGATVVNALLSLNRVGRGNAALFVLLSFGALGTQISILTHLVLAMTASVWYNGLNDLFDLEIDRAAYAKAAYRKVLLNGAMSARGLWLWLVVLSAASAVLLVTDVGANVWCLVLFSAGILSSVVYNLNSKYLTRPSAVKFIVLDAIVGGPFFFFYASLAALPNTLSDTTVSIGTIGSLLACGLYGNFIFAAKDLSTDARSTKTFPMLLGSTLGERGVVRHSAASKGYLVSLFTLTAILLGYVALKGHWFAILFAGRLLVSTVQVCSDHVTERGHRRLFVALSNWEMAFLLSLYIRTLSLDALAQVIILGAVIVLANVAYYHDERANRALMLRFGRAKQT